MRVILINYLLFFMASFAFGQEIAKSVIKGKVNNNEEAVPYTQVIIEELKLGAVADAEGNYVISNIPAGTYTIIAKSIGFVEQTKAVTIQSGATVTINFTLKEDEKTLDEIVIEDRSITQEIRESGFNVNAIDTKELLNTSQSLNKVLNTTSGIRIRETGGMGSSFSFSLNGFTGSQVKFFLDGIPIENYGSSLTLNNLPINLADRIEVYKGVVPVDLGADALGGAVNIITKQHITRYVDASYTIGSFNTHQLSINGRHTFTNGMLVNLNAFGNYSDNNYDVDVSIADRQTGKFLPVQPYERFHDGYKSGTVMMEAGVKGK